MTIFERTQQIAKEQGISLRDLESKAGLAEKSLYKWKTYNPRMDNVQKVADVLHVSVDYLLGNTDEKNPHPIKDEDKKTDLAEALSLDQVKSELTSFGGKPVTDHDAKLIKQYLETLFEGRD